MDRGQEGQGHEEGENDNNYNHPFPFLNHHHNNHHPQQQEEVINNINNNNEQNPDSILAIIETPNEHDILLGRGRPLQTHPGNLRLTQIIQKHRRKYQDAPRNKRRAIANQILDNVKAHPIHPGRFLENIGPNQWIEVDDEIAGNKISHGLREKNPKTRKVPRNEFLDYDEEQHDSGNDNNSFISSLGHSNTLSAVTSNNNTANLMAASSSSEMVQPPFNDNLVYPEPPAASTSTPAPAPRHNQELAIGGYSTSLASAVSTARPFFISSFVQEQQLSYEVFCTNHSQLTPSVSILPVFGGSSVPASIVPPFSNRRTNSSAATMVPSHLLPRRSGNFVGIAQSEVAGAPTNSISQNESGGLNLGSLVLSPTAHSGGLYVDQITSESALLCGTRPRGQNTEGESQPLIIQEPLAIAAGDSNSPASVTSSRSGGTPNTTGVSSSSLTPELVKFLLQLETDDNEKS